MNKFIITAAVLFATGQANAADIYLLTIKAQETGDRTAKVGIRTNAQNEPESMIFLAHGDKTPEVYSIKRATRSPVVMVKKFMVNIVTFQATNVTSHSMRVDFEYLHNHRGISFDYNKKTISVNYNPTTNRYEARDLVSDRVITQIFATSNYVNGELKGIDEIKSW